MFWREDPHVQRARKHPGWVQFHKRCGDTGMFFDDIEPKGRGYGCVTFRSERLRNGTYRFFKIADGSGRGVIEAVLAGFDASVAAGWPVDPAVRELLVDGPAPQPAAPVVEDDDLLGGPVAAVDDDLEDFGL